VVAITGIIVADLHHKYRVEQCELALEGWQLHAPVEITMSDYWDAYVNASELGGLRISTGSDQPIMFKNYIRATRWAHWADICQECVEQGYLDEADLYE
jgi:hypothetical protein